MDLTWTSVPVDEQFKGQIHAMGYHSNNTFFLFFPFDFFFKFFIFFAKIIKYTAALRHYRHELKRNSNGLKRNYKHGLKRNSKYRL